MAKFLNKKEQVIDFRLTPYGKYLLSMGTFKPVYYSFFDSEVLYDGAYAGITESQNSVHDRIKKNTQYLESLVCFRELETSPPYSSDYKQSMGARFSFDIAGAEAKMFDRLSADATFGGTLAGISGEGATPESLYKYLHQVPRADAFKFESAIGDARFDGNKQQNAPAWKIVTLQGMISSSAAENIDFLYEKSWGRNEQKIPQIDIDANYNLRAATRVLNLDPNSVSDILGQTQTFPDGNVVELVQDNILVYAQEVNTEILNENFDIEVYEVERVQGNFGNGIIEIKTDPSQGDTITIADGTGASNTYEFRSSYTSVAVGNVWVPYYPGDDKSDALSSFKDVFTNYMRTPGGSIPAWAAVDGISTAEAYKIAWNLYLNLYITDHIYLDSSTGLAKIKFEIKSNIGGLNADKGSLSSTAPDSRINVSGITGSTNTIETLTRKDFASKNAQIVNGYMVSPHQTVNSSTNLGTGSVEYYFDVFTDMEVNRTLACRGAQLYDNNSYYLDLDFECESEENTCAADDPSFYDIYGKVVEDPDICQ